jgi:hypothetical protein
MGKFDAFVFLFTSSAIEARSEVGASKERMNKKSVITEAGLQMMG